MSQYALYCRPLGRSTNAIYTRKKTIELIDLIWMVYTITPRANTIILLRLQLITYMENNLIQQNYFTQKDFSWKTKT